MTSPAFDDVDIPTSDDLTPGDGALNVDGVTCDWPDCDTPPVYRNGRLQKRCDEHYRKRANSAAGSGDRAPRRSSGQVEAALAAMDTMYGLVSVGFMLLSEDAAHEWAAKQQSLQLTNRLAFEADPKLCRSVSKAAGKGGSLLFAATNGAAVLTCGAIVLNEQRARGKGRKPRGKSGSGNTPSEANGHAPGQPDLRNVL